MELLKPNFFDTTTAAVVQSNTAGVSYLMDRDPTYQYVSSGFNSDLTSTTIRINFNETMTVSRIALLGINLKDFIVYYGGVTANTFALTTTGSTITSQFSANSETSLFLRCTPTYCTSLSIDCRKTMVADAEKAIGHLLISEVRVDFERDPNSKNYKPQSVPKDVVHKLSDGGTRIQYVAEKFGAKIKLEYITLAFKNQLKAAWKLKREHVFAPFGTTTAWDEVIFPCVWEGVFDFESFSDDAPSAGFTGTITLLETPT